MIRTTYVINHRGASTYNSEMTKAHEVMLSWDLDDTTIIDVSHQDGSNPHRVTLADLRSWVKQRDIDTAAAMHRAALTAQWEARTGQEPI